MNQPEDWFHHVRPDEGFVRTWTRRSAPRWLGDRLIFGSQRLPAHLPLGWRHWTRIGFLLLASRLQHWFWLRLRSALDYCVTQSRRTTPICPSLPKSGHVLSGCVSCHRSTKNSSIGWHCVSPLPPGWGPKAGNRHQRSAVCSRAYPWRKSVSRKIRSAVFFWPGPFLTAKPFLAPARISFPGEFCRLSLSGCDVLVPFLSVNYLSGCETVGRSHHNQHFRTRLSCHPLPPPA